MRDPFACQGLSSVPFFSLQCTVASAATCGVVLGLDVIGGAESEVLRGLQLGYLPCDSLRKPCAVLALCDACNGCRYRWIEGFENDVADRSALSWS